MVDRQGQAYEPPHRLSNEAPLTPAQEAARQAKNWSASAKHRRNEARLASPAMSRILEGTADKFEARAEELDARADEHTLLAEAVS